MATEHAEISALLYWFYKIVSIHKKAVKPLLTKGAGSELP